jgi:hypothetical protein
MQTRTLLLLILTAVAFQASAAFAQTAPGTPGSDQVIPEKDRSNPKTSPQGEPLQSGRSESLSEKLDASGGVIKPKPGVDPGIVKPAPVPEPNSTPVIQPRGTPRGPAGPEPK